MIIRTVLHYRVHQFSEQGDHVTQMKLDIQGLKLAVVNVQNSTDLRLFPPKIFHLENKIGSLNF